MVNSFGVRGFCAVEAWLDLVTVSSKANFITTRTMPDTTT